MIDLDVFFRTDASFEIGTGHVMRCLTLADTLRQHGAKCVFVSREHPGNLLNYIRERGFEVCSLPRPQGEYELTGMETPALPAHEAWLGTEWRTDALQTSTVLGNVQADWLIVDHYALDARWEALLRPLCRRLMVIDDLADRNHECDLLLDQNLGSEKGRYIPLVGGSKGLLIGPKYALLRAEFAKLRRASLSRRVTGNIRNILVTMGGVDNANATGRVLKALDKCELPTDCRIRVAMGPSAPWLREVRSVAKNMDVLTEISVNVSNMAELMVDCDLAIGAAGSTSWERCCLGIPSIMCVLADNQIGIAESLAEAGAATAIYNIDDSDSLVISLSQVINNTELVKSMGLAGAVLVDGEGASRVASHLLMSADQ